MYKPFSTEEEQSTHCGHPASLADGAQSENIEVAFR